MLCGWPSCDDLIPTPMGSVHILVRSENVLISEVSLERGSVHCIEHVAMVFDRARGAGSNGQRVW